MVSVYIHNKVKVLEYYLKIQNKKRCFTLGRAIGGGGGGGAACTGYIGNMVMHGIGT